MKSIISALLVTVLISGFSLTSYAQQPSGKLEVTTQLKETEGTYDQRKLYRKFLVQYMKDCPYVSHFSVEEAVGKSDNHKVQWSYQVNSWSDITKFYGWVTEQLKATKEEGLKMALTPYGPDYALGGQIHVSKRGKTALARD